MKMLLTGLLIPLYCILSAQNITTAETTAVFRSVTRNAIITTIYENGLKEVLFEWEMYLKKNKCERVANEGGEIYGHNVFLKEIVNKPIDIYAKLERDSVNKIIMMSAAIDIGAGNYLKSDNNPSEVNVFKEKLREFALKMTKAPIEGYIKAAKDFQIKLKTEIDVFEKNKKEIGESIMKMQNRISKTEKELGVKNNSLRDNETKLKENELLMSKDIDSESMVSLKKINQKLVAKKNEIVADINQLQLSIDKEKLEIKNAEIEIESINSTQNKHLKEIQDQKAIEEVWQKKLSKIY